MIDAVVQDRFDALRSALVDCGRVVVAFSGGVDSGLLAQVAHETLGPDRATIVTAVSPTFAALEHEDAAALASEQGWSWRAVDTDEMASAAYRLNDSLRCFHCKDALMDALTPIAAAAAAVVVLGVNVDDLGEHRPGQRAAAQRNARFPMVESGLTKADVRSIAHELGLRIWDKPAAACLASRLPYGTPVSLGRLTMVEEAEAALRAMGFASLRVRHYEDTARVEVPLGDLDRLIARRADVVRCVRAAGYRYVTVDLEGLRSGNLNVALKDVVT